MAKKNTSFEHSQLESQRLKRAASAMLDAADTAARRGDTATEERALAAFDRLHDAATKGGKR
ncbi:MAG: hypothetical protein HOV73_25950 [Streptomyces sp.]|nr:hypothetical protein [Streptomyces sp.]NUR43530.1 hypothetical protein [Streptomyces sp.]NUS15224.1 hypothetical protein [Streptomyces sp.]NUS25564.1 hypothetical protein [Streptomyces sp.]NUS77345.1 hypothetical protein [Streptomyces sp.]